MDCWYQKQYFVYKSFDFQVQIDEVLHQEYHKQFGALEELDNKYQPFKFEEMENHKEIEVPEIGAYKAVTPGVVEGTLGEDFDRVGEFEAYMYLNDLNNYFGKDRDFLEEDYIDFVEDNLAAGSYMDQAVDNFEVDSFEVVGGLNALVKEAFKRWKYQENNVDDITAILIFFE